MANQELEARVKEALETMRPSLQADGGDLEYVRMDDDNKVYLRLIGACGSCPMATMTLKMGVESYLKETVPEVSEVVQELGIDCWLENVERNQVTGTWRTENGKIWFQDTANPGAEEGSAAYTLAGDQLKLTEMNNVCFNRDLTQDDTLTLKRRAD